MIRAIIKTVFQLSAICILAGCGKEKTQTTSNNSLTIFTSLPPVQYLVEQITGDRAVVQTLLKPGRDLHVFEPTTKQMMLLAQSDIYFTIGLPFEKHISETLSKKSTLSDLTRNVTFRSFGDHTCSEHDHDHHDHHNHGSEQAANDPHIWLGPVQLKTIASSILATLKEKDSTNAEYYERRFNSLIKRLADTVDYCSLQLKAKAGTTVMVFHPSFGYFFDYFHLNQEAIEVDGKAPSAKQLMSIINESKKEKITTLFIQPQFDKRSAETIAKAIGGQVNTLDPLAKDILANFKTMADAIAGSSN